MSHSPKPNHPSRRKFIVGSLLAGGYAALAKSARALEGSASLSPSPLPAAPADYTLRIGVSLIELAPDHIVSTITYNGQFPGPLLRLKEGQPVTVDVHNDTDTPEQLHWHGQFVPVDVDGAAEEGTPYIPARGTRRITFTPGPAGLRFYHTHIAARNDLTRGLYNGQAGPVYIEPKREPGDYDREVFLVLKEFDPVFSRGGDMAQDFLAGKEVAGLKKTGETSMQSSLAKGMPHGYEVSYGAFSINGRKLGHGEPIRVRPNERILFHVLNASAGEIRSLALPGHTFKVVALDGNPVPLPGEVPVLWLGTAERVSAIVEMKHPGVWVLGDLSDDDRKNGMGVVIEYASRKGKAQWKTPAPFHWDYTLFGKTDANTTPPDNVIEMTFANQNAAANGFNLWTINNVPFSMKTNTPKLQLSRGQRYRLRMRNASDDIHPVHLHRNSFELTKIAGRKTRGVMKDVVMLGGYQELEVDFVADQAGLNLFHCHQQLHMDYGFMTLFDVV
ncbi:MAG: multicopper oxidase family protein [Rhodanobacteraceae bacterium]